MRGHTMALGRSMRTGTLSKPINNEFYTGVIVVKGMRYPGVHEPLVSRDTFDRVQIDLRECRPRRRPHQQFNYHGCLRCRTCQHILIGEKQKAFTYYRCHHWAVAAEKAWRSNRAT